jgi:hypothetical protein
MTAKELQKRGAKAENLRVLQTDDGGAYFCESEEGKILYNVVINDNGMSCTCGDWARGVKKDAGFRCKHILSVLNCIPTGEVEGAHYLDRKKPQLDPRFIISIDGNDFVKYQGLLDMAHQKGIAQIEVETIQLPSAENGNFAVCKANVVSKSGESFTDIGDASPQSCNSKVVKHLLRIASTRAIARALRSFTNIGMTCLEELADLNDVAGNDSGNGKAKTSRPAARMKPAEKPLGDKQKEPPPVETKGVAAEQKTQPNAAQESKKTVAGEPMGAPKGESKGNGKPTGEPKISDAQLRACMNLSRRRGISVDELHRMALETYGIELEYLTVKDASSFIRSLQTNS